jgi:hypothetical protein
LNVSSWADAMGAKPIHIAIAGIANHALFICVSTWKVSISINKSG